MWSKLSSQRTADSTGLGQAPCSDRDTFQAVGFGLWGLM